MDTESRITNKINEANNPSLSDLVDLIISAGRYDLTKSKHVAKFKYYLTSALMSNDNNLEKARDEFLSGALTERLRKLMH